MTTDATDDLDYGTDGAPNPAIVQDAAAQIDSLALEAETTEAAIEALEAEIEAKKKYLAQILTRELPELLGRMKLKSVTTISGLDVALGRVLRASLPAEDKDPESRAAGLKWLIDNGHDGVIKNLVSVSLDRGSDAKAAELAARLEAEGYDVKAKKDVNHNTLSALVRELVIEQKQNPPTKILGIFDQEIAKIRRRK